MNAQYNDSITTDGAGYSKNPADEIGYMEGSDADMGVHNTYAETNIAYPISDLPTNANSTKRAAPALSASQDSPAPVGDSCC